MRKLLGVVMVLSVIGLGSSPALGQNETVTLVFSDWHLTENPWQSILVDAIGIFEAQHPTIDVELEAVNYNDKETRYITEIESGIGPDVFHLHAYSLKSFMARNYLYDITPFIEKEPGVYGGDFLTPWYPQTLELMQDEHGNYFAMPGDFMAMVLFYNAELFERAGLDPAQPPTTWAEFLAYAQALTDGETYGFGTIGAIDPGFELRFSPVLFSHGADYLTPDNKCSALNTPEAKEAFTFFVDLYTRYGVIPPESMTDVPQITRQRMADGQVAMLLGSGWTPSIINLMNPDLNAFETLIAAPVPRKDGIDTEFTTTAWLSAWVINRDSAHPEEAWELVKFITSLEMERKWFDEGNVLSSRRDVSGGLEDQGIVGYDNLLNDPLASVIANELHHAKFVPQIPEWPQIITMINVAVREGFSGTKTPEEALADAHDTINKILSVYRDASEICPPFTSP